MYFLLFSNALVLFIFGQQLYLKLFLAHTPVESLRKASGLLIGISPFVLSFCYLSYTALRSISKNKKNLSEQNILDEESITNSDEE